MLVRGGHDGGNYIHIMHSQPLNCFGQVKAWRFWAESRNGGFKAGVYRALSDTEYYLLGETEVPNGHPLSEAYTYEIQNQDDWISFQPGDVIGWRWFDSGSGIRYDSNTESIAMKRASHTNDNYYNMMTGDTFTVSSDINRAYSLQAVLSPKGKQDHSYSILF